MAARPNLCLLHEAKIVTIKGQPGTGLRPYINFISVRYTSPLLASSPALIGKKLRIYYDPRDIRVVKAFFDDGTELGILSAARPWCFTPHSLKVRREIFKLLAERKLTSAKETTPSKLGFGCAASNVITRCLRGLWPSSSGWSKTVRPMTMTRSTNHTLLRPRPPQLTCHTTVNQR